MKMTELNMEVSKLIIAMKDFADDVTFGEIETIGKSNNLLNQAEEQFKRVASILNDANYFNKRFALHAKDVKDVDDE